jgi:hypothetical protein
MRDKGRSFRLGARIHGDYLSERPFAASSVVQRVSGSGETGPTPLVLALGRMLVLVCARRRGGAGVMLEDYSILGSLRQATLRRHSGSSESSSRRATAWRKGRGRVRKPHAWPTPSRMDASGCLLLSPVPADDVDKALMPMSGRSHLTCTKCNAPLSAGRILHKWAVSVDLGAWIDKTRCAAPEI